MAINFSGKKWRGTLMHAVISQMKTFTLKPVKKMTVQFDPFSKNVKCTRDFLNFISAPKLLKTNLACNLKTNIVCDRSEPIITCDLINGEQVLFKCNNLDVVDIFKLYNKHIVPLSPPEPEPDRPGIIKLKKRKVRVITPKYRR